MINRNRNTRPGVLGEVPGQEAENPFMESDRPYIECRDLFKIYKRADLEVVALRGVDVEVRSGEMVGIVGTSGSGKSTLLNILSGLDRPSAGQVRVGDRDLLDISDRDLVIYRRLEVGFVWQATGRNLAPYLNVQENLELPMAIAGVEGGARRRRIGELLEALGIGDKVRRLPHELSGGEQQRVAIGVAMSTHPPLILADEPTGELDNQTGAQVIELLRTMNRTYGVTIIIVTHHPGVTEAVDRVLHIRDGRISSETYMHLTYQRSGERVEQEYLVVDRAGRLQLPQGYSDRFRSARLATAQVDGEQVTIRPATGEAMPQNEQSPQSPDNPSSTSGRD